MIAAAIRSPRGRLARILVAFAVLWSLMGCGGREMAQLPIVLGMAADVEQAGMLTITVQMVPHGDQGQPTGGGSARSEPKGFWNVQGVGRTVLDACRQITKVIGERLFVSHCQVIILSRAVAEAGVESCVDALIRDREARSTSLILVSTGDAAEILDTESAIERQPALAIANLVRQSGWVSEARIVRRNDFARMLLCPTTAPTAPLISVVPGLADSPVLAVSGTAVFRGTRMVGALDPVQSRGLLWVLGEVRSAALVVPAGDGLATLEVISVKSTVRPEVRDGRPRIAVHIQCNLALAEQTTAQDLATPVQFSDLESAAERLIGSEVLAAFEHSAQLGADIFGFGDLIRKKLPGYWQEVAQDWHAVYPAVDLAVQVQTKMRGTGSITRPVFSIGQ